MHAVCARTPRVPCVITLTLTSDVMTSWHAYARIRYPRTRINKETGIDRQAYTSQLYTTLGAMAALTMARYIHILLSVAVTAFTALYKLCMVCIQRT